MAKSRLNLNTGFGRGFAQIESDSVAKTVTLQRIDGAGVAHAALTMDQVAGNVTGPVGQSVAVATSGTIATAGLSSSIVTPAGAVTGVILQPGTSDGQIITVVNTAVAANTVTFAAAGTSNVADGVSSVIAGLTAARFAWSATAGLWYHCK